MRSIFVAAAVTAALALSACSHPGGHGPGPGAMGAGPMGSGPMGPHGAMGGGPGPMGSMPMGGMGGMGGMGPGPGMGMGMMGAGPAWGPGGMGMMAGPGTLWGLERLDLSAEQRTRIAQIQDEARRQHQAMMQAMHAQGGPMAQVMGGTALDDEAARQAYARMADVHRQMFDAHLQTRRRILEVLTPAQREQLGRAWAPR